MFSQQFNIVVYIHFQESDQCDYGDLVDERFYFTLEEQLARQVGSSFCYVSPCTTKPMIWALRPAKTWISLGICSLGCWNEER